VQIAAGFDVLVRKQYFTCLRARCPGKMRLKNPRAILSNEWVPIRTRSTEVEACFIYSVR
jgi:hypothetical protein